MRKYKSNIGIIAFVLVALATTSVIFISNTSSQERRNGDDVNISWSPKKREIKSADSKLALSLPDSLANQDWVIGVMPVKNDENESIIVGAVSWKDGNMGPQTILSGVNDVSDDSITISKGLANLENAKEFSSESGKSLLILLNVKPGTQISVAQKDEQLIAETSTNDGAIIKKPAQLGMSAIGIKKVTGVSSLMGELQTQRFFQRFEKK